MLPGFQDAHIHLMEGGLAQRRYVIPEGASLSAIQSSLKEYAAAHPEAAWIQGGGWAYNVAPKGTFPTRQMLDMVVADRPVILESYDGHAVWLNTEALKRAGIKADTKVPSGGTIVRESDGATPQGTLLENAWSLIEKAAPKPSKAEYLAGIKTGIAYCLRLGITSVNTLNADEAEIGFYRRLLAKGELPIRVRISPFIEGNIRRYEALRRKLRSPFLQIGPLKGFVDGVIESKTAFMLDPYPGTTGRGKPQIESERLKELVARAHSRGFGVALHSIGDAAVRLSLDAIEAAVNKYPDITVRHRVDHIETIHPDDLPRFAELGAVASMQPFHSNPEGDDPDSGPWAENLGPERLKRSFTWRSLLDNDAPLAFGSDWNVMSANPLWGIAVASTRQSREGKPKGGWNAHEAITAREALDAYTTGTAYALGTEKDLGSLVPGKLADVIILSPKVRLERPETLWNGKVMWTIVDGKVRYRAE